jgi:hypothetical protein
MNSCVRILLLVGACGWLSACGKPPEKYVRVAGKVMVNGVPLTGGQVGFMPDETSGTTHFEYSIGEVQPDGTYQLVTNDKGGVRPGWYRVVVWASVEPMSPTPAYDANGQLKPIRWKTAAKYTRKETTDLRLEVVENPAPGAYDLSLSPP